MDTALILHLTGPEIVIDTYNTVDISRRKNELHINVTNVIGNLAFNGIFEQIQEHLGDDESFSITIKQEKGQATFADMAVSYHLNAGGEVLHFSKRPIQIMEENAEQ